MEISGRTKVIGIIGDPIEHTLSPAMHNAAFRSMSLEFVYVAFRVRKGALENAMSAMRNLGILGLNVTMPHKRSIIEYIDVMDPGATTVNAVNTISNDNGKLTGFNTDGVGALRALKENNVDLTGTKAIILGAGSAAKAITFHLATKVNELVILNRSGEKVRKLGELLSKSFDTKIESRILTTANIDNELKDSDILINATSVGMHPNSNQSLIKPEWFRPDLCVMDIIYSPLETKLIKDARSTGAKVIPGIQMLIFQGATSFEIWTNHPAPIQVMEQAVNKEFLKIGVLP